MRYLKKRLNQLTLLVFSVVIIGLGYYYFSRPSLCKPMGQSLNLGAVNFPTSTSNSNARKHFELGLRYLHNFMYPLAIREFNFSKQEDPNFALSYWGIAMSYNWALWSYLDKAKGLKALYEWEDVKDKQLTPLEKDLLAAISIIYGEGSKIENDKKYINAMAALHQRYPDNVDIASFYALALLGYQTDVPFDIHNEQYLQKARDVLKPFIKTHPNHPGVLHYFIHASDVAEPKIAKEALVVVENIFRYMNHSSHVLHMPSHLYTELGNWSEAVEANKRSIAASHHLCRFLQKENIHLDLPLSMCSTVKAKPRDWSIQKWYACDADNIYHSTEWLHFEYLQLGQYQEAEKVMDNIQIVVDTINEPMYRYWLYRVMARQIIYSENWVPQATLPQPITLKNKDIYWAAYSESGLLLAQGLRAIHHRQVAMISQIEKRFDSILALMKDKEEGGFRNACALMRSEFLAAKLYYMNHKPNEGLRLLEKELAQNPSHLSQFSFTLPFIPLQEFYASLLVEKAGKKNLLKAVDLYNKELTYYPNRAQIFLGLGRAHTKLGNKKLASYAFAKWNRSL